MIKDKEIYVLSSTDDIPKRRISWTETDTVYFVGIIVGFIALVLLAAVYSSS